MKITADMMKALGDETRLRILALLAGGELCVCEIFAALGLPQSTVSRHLAILRRAGWVIDQRRGSWMYYHLVAEDDLRTPVLKSLLPHLASLERGLEDRKNLQRSLEQQKLGGAC